MRAGAFVEDGYQNEFGASQEKGYLGSVFAKSVDGFPIDWMRAEVTFLDKNID